MKAVFNCHRNDQEWIRYFFPGENPYLLPVVNKPLIGYWVDFCSLTSVTEILILDEEYDQQLEEFLGDGSKWNLKISYQGENISADCSSLPEHHNAFFQDSDVLIFNGMFFLHYNKLDAANDATNWLRQMDFAKPSSVTSGLLFQHDKQLFPLEAHIMPVDGIQNYFQINMFVLKSVPECYVIPGYQVEKNVYTGMNDIIPHDCEIEAPVALSDDNSIGRRCTLKNGVILGKNVVIDDGSILEEAIVFDNTYISSELEFVRKIVFRNMVIDPDTQLVLNLFELNMTRDISNTEALPLFQRIFGWIESLFLLFMLLPGFITATLFFRSKETVNHYFYAPVSDVEKLDEMLFYPDFSKSVSSPRLRHVFWRFCLDKFYLLLLMLAGRIRLVGDFPYDSEQLETKRFIQSHYPNYHPGVFQRSEVSQSGNNENSYFIHDLDYKYNRSFWLEQKIVFQTLIGRLLMSK